MTQTTTERLALTDGTNTFKVNTDGYIHYITFQFNGATPTAGTAALRGRGVKSSIFEDIPVTSSSNVVDLTDARQISFTGSLSELEVVIAGHTGSSTSVDISVSPFGGTATRDCLLYTSDAADE